MFPLSTSRVLICLLMAGICQADEEMVLDRRVHIEQDLIREIPPIRRLCDSMEISKGRMRVGDCELYCEQQGQGMPIVLLHGGPGGTHHCFHPSFSQAGKFAKVIYYDQRGCGLSDYKKGKGYSVDQAVDDLENLRKALDVDRWIVLGYSYGGLLAQCYALKYPDHLAGLVLVGSTPAMSLSLDRTRQYDFLSQKERARIGEIHNTSSLSSAQSVYNAFLNGDWKRQHYRKPSPEKMARIALYEWEHDADFRAIMSPQIKKVDLTGTFEGCPIPTLIVEGRWDLTWNTDKPGKLHKNHPGAKLVMLEESGHSPFADEPDKFFAALGDFVENVSKATPTPADLAAWKNHLANWREKRDKSPAHIVWSVGWGRKSNEKIVKDYSEQWIDQLDNPIWLMKTGFALYDLERYADALVVFRKMQAAAGDNKLFAGVSLVWQGHMLDLLNRRDEAVAAYKKAVALNVTSSIQHDQFGMAYCPSSYAAQRINEPFKRIENLEENTSKEKEPIGAINQTDRFELPKAVRQGDLKGVGNLIDRGADVNARNDNDDATLLHWAAWQGNTAIAELLIAKGADVNAKAHHEDTPLHLAVEAGNEAVVKLLINKGADVNAREVHAETPLHLAAKAGNTAIAEMLIAKGARISAKAISGVTPLDLAEKGGHKAVADLLRKHLPKQRPKKSVTSASAPAESIDASKEAVRLALPKAVREGDLEKVRSLIAKGANVDAKYDQNGNTLLHIAAAKNHKLIVELLVAMGAKVNTQNAQGRTALHLAAAQGHGDVVNFLTQKAMIKATDNQGRLALHLAADQGHLEVVRLLAPWRTTLNVAEDTQGWTPLHLAARRGHKDVVELLVAEGADVNVKDKSGRTPLDLAVAGRHKDVADLLRNRKGGAENSP